jgi:class 3 adenylate cyclase
MSIPIDTEQAAGIVPLGVVNFAARTGEMVVVDDAEADERFLSDPLIQQRETRSILCQPIMSQGELIGLVYLENSLVSAAFTPERAHLVSLLSGQIAVSLRNAQLVENLEEKVRERTRQLEIHSKFIEQTFGRYLSSEIAERILKSEDGLDFRGRKRVVTVMMSDIRGFTSFADRLAPEKIVELLNNYLSEMTTVIQTYNGTIDNFIGDAILTVFGVPFQRPDDAERAVACALQMQLAMERVNEWNAARDLPALEMGIGINTGEVVVGNIGSHRRAKYGVIGSNVNLAARIESFTVGGQVLISGPTRKAVRVPLTVSEALTVEPKGLAEPLPIYEVRAIGGSYGLETRGEPARHTTIDPPVRISYRLVEGKVVVGETWPGELIGLAVNEAVLRGGNTLPPYTDLQLTVEPSDDNAAIVGLYAKVLDRRAEDGAFAIRFTALPPQARLFLSRFGEVANDAAWR